ncbi:MAG TPA: S41 family peptidase [Solirubrobacteraceae bacterium]|nr:S41 family peptidase [Solirubrobacteraceae bacterium]
MFTSRPRRSPLRELATAAGLVALVLVGLWFGGHPSWLPAPLRSIFVSKTADERQVQTVLNLISKDYYRPENTQALLNTGLEAAVASLKDPYSHYYPPAGFKQFEQVTNPQVSGIGVETATKPVDGGLEIDDAIQGSPAARAGLRHGDVIVAVGDTSLKGKTVNAAANLIRGRVGTSVALTYLRAGKSHKVTIRRANVSVPVAASTLVHYQGRALGYLEFTQFAQGSAAELKTQVRKMLKAGAQGLILDLRDNPGGLLEQAIGVASLFIKQGTIVTTRGRNQPTTVYTALGGAIAAKIPMVVLVNRDTASSAEIVTAALKDRGRAKVVGTNTYGKGVFQQLMPLAAGAWLDITVGEYFTPNGQNLGGGGVKQGKGITPNVYVKPNGKGPSAFKVAEQTVAAEIH